MPTSNYCVYILTNTFHSVIYIGVTNDLTRRISEHKQKIVKGFTKKYNIDTLVYYENFSDINFAIKREKELKGWTRAKKFVLIKSINPELEDLSKDWT